MRRRPEFAIGISTGGGSVVAERPDKCRIVIATLDVSQALPTALIDLDANRIAPADLCLAGSADALAAAHRALEQGGAAAARFLPLVREVEPLAMPVPDLTLLATSSRLFTCLKGAVSGIDRNHLDGRCWLAQPLRTGLAERMTRGDVMLIAGPLSSEHMKLGTRVLLQHSRHPVQSHELVTSPVR
jgi:hypothetical protein